MPAIERAVSGNRPGGHPALRPVGKQIADRLVQFGLIAFQGQDILPAGLGDGAGHLPLAAHGVDGHHRAGQHHLLQQRGQGHDLIFMPGHLQLPQGDA